MRNKKTVRKVARRSVRPLVANRTARKGVTETQLWKGRIFAEAATEFKDGTRFKASGLMELEDAKKWTEETLAILLEEEEQISMAHVVHDRSGECFDYDPSSWGGKIPTWIDTREFGIELESPAKMKQKAMAERAKQRSPNYPEMTAREQWEEDKLLGILDWDGTEA